MPPKGKDKGKGPIGNYKPGRLLKDILPPNTKPPREGQVVKVEEQPDVQRSYTYDPYINYPDWTTNDDAKNHNFGLKDHLANALGGEEAKKFTDESKIYLPPSFHDYEKNEILWLRPE